MPISSRTPEGRDQRCTVCGTFSRIEPSSPNDDAPCPACGHLLWFLPSVTDRVRKSPVRRRIPAAVTIVAFTFLLVCLVTISEDLREALVFTLVAVLLFGKDAFVAVSELFARNAPQQPFV